MSLDRTTYNHNILGEVSLFLIILKVILIKKIDIGLLVVSRFSSSRRRELSKLFPFGFRLFFSVRYHNTKRKNVYICDFIPLLSIFFCLHEPKKTLCSNEKVKSFSKFFLLFLITPSVLFTAINSLIVAQHRKIKSLGAEGYHILFVFFLFTSGSFFTDVLAVNRHTT